MDEPPPSLKVCRAEGSWLAAAGTAALHAPESDSDAASDGIQRMYPEDIDDSCERHFVDAPRYGPGRKKARVECCLCADFELFAGFQMDNGVAELEAAFADLHLGFRLYSGIENSDAGSGTRENVGWN